MKIKKTLKRIQDLYLSSSLGKDLVPEVFHLTEAALGIGTSVHKVRVGYGKFYSPRDNVVDSFNSLHKAVEMTLACYPAGTRLYLVAYLWSWLPTSYFQAPKRPRERMSLLYR